MTADTADSYRLDPVIEDEPLYTLHRGRLCAPGRDPVKLRRLGKGQFCAAYLIDSGPNLGRVLLAVRGGCSDKEILRELHRDNPANPHLPAVVQFGDLRDGGQLYTAPLYRKLSKAEAPKAWADWLLIRRAQATARKHLDAWRNGRWHRTRQERANDGAYYNQFFIDEVRSIGLGAPLMDALLEVFEWAGNFGSTVWMEFRPGNLGVDSAGRLVLLDPTFDMELLYKQQDAKRKERERKLSNRWR